MTGILREGGGRFFLNKGIELQETFISDLHLRGS